MKRIFSLLVLAFATMFASTSLLAQVQPRDFGGHRLWLDNNSNINAPGYFTYMLQAPAGLSANTTYTFPLIPAGGTAGFVQAGASSGQTLYWNTTSSSWQPSSMLMNDNANGVAVTNGSVLITGTTGATPASGAGTRMEWIPAHAALRAGVVSGTNWDDANIGTNSVAFGFDALASNTNSIAIGGLATSTGINSVAIGPGTIASGGNAIAIGNGAKATVGSAVALGFTTTASGGISTAMGFGTTASGAEATAMGYQTVASNLYATAMGYLTTAAGQASVTMGSNATANNAGSFVYGDNSGTSIADAAANTFTVLASGGTTFYQNTAKTESVSFPPAGGITIFGGNEFVNGGSMLFTGTTGATPASGAGTRMEWIPALGALRAGTLDNFSLTTPTNWDNANIGQYSVALGYDTKASGLGSLALGQVTTASGIGTTALGSRATANSNASFVYGDGTAPISDGGFNSFTVLASGGTTFYQNSGLLASVAFPAAGGLTVTANTGLATETNVLAQDAHLRSQITTAPTVTTQTNCTGTLSNATDVAGRVTIVTTANSSVAATIQFNKAYTIDPIVIITPTNQNAGDIQSIGAGFGEWVTTPGTGASFTINLFQSAAVTTYTFNYFVIETQ